MFRIVQMSLQTVQSVIVPLKTETMANHRSHLSGSVSMHELGSMRHIKAGAGLAVVLMELLAVVALLALAFGI
jgi:hypothetical protein